MNPFERLCILASKENWCWRIGCTTCGHLHFRYSFAELAAGNCPADEDWPINRRRTNYMNQLGDWPRKYSDEQKRKVLEVCADVEISLIADRCRYPDWLGYLGLILHHMRCNHDAYQEVSSRWAQQLRDMLPSNSQIYHHFDHIVTGGHRRLNIRDLEKFESSARTDIVGPDEQYNLDLDSPEARTNFATRHIRNLSERRRRRSELLKRYRDSKVVDMFPGNRNPGPRDA
jgi:hypothetical protein